MFDLRGTNKRNRLIVAVMSIGAEGGIVSEGVAQVIDGLGNPHSHCGV
jgi:hypothetical protein